MRIIKNSIITLAITIIILSLLLNATYLTLNILPNKNTLFSKLASTFLHQPVQIKQVKISGYAWFPVVMLKEVTIDRIHLHQLQVSFNLWKMMAKKKWVVDQIAIDRLRLRVEETQGNHFAVSGFSSEKMMVSKNNTRVKHALEWLAMQPNVIFSNTEIMLVQKNKPPINITPFNFMITKHNEQHIVSAQLTIKQSMPTKISFIAHVKGKQSSVFFQIQQMQLSQWIPWLTQYGVIQNIKNISGLLNVKTWLEVNNQHWEHVLSAFSATDVKVGNFGVSHFSGELNAVPDRGAMLLADKSAQITLPTLPFEKLLPGQFFTKLSWMQQKTGWTLHVDSFKFHNPQWNIFSKLKSHIDIQAKSILSFSGGLSLNHAQFESISGSLANDRDRTLMMRGKMQAPLSTLFELEDMPEMSGAGDVLCEFNVAIPLIGQRKMMIHHARIVFLNNDIHFLPWKMKLTHLTGGFMIDEGTYESQSLRADFLGTPLFIILGGNKNIHVMLQGGLNPSELSMQLHSPFLSLFNKKIPFIAQFTLADLRGDHFSDIALTLPDLYFLKQSWGSAQLIVNYHPEHTSIHIENNHAVGVIHLNMKNKLALNVQLQHLFLKKSSIEDQGMFDKRMINPGSIPSLSLSIDHLRIDDRNEGSFQFVSDPVNNGMVIRRFAMQTPLFQLIGKGGWFLRDHHEETELSGSANSSDFGAFLMQRHLSSRLQGGELLSEFSLRWPGSLQQFSLSRSNGKVEINLKKGRILHLDSDTESNLNVGRILNLLSLETLSQTLTFGNNSVAKKGFPFDYLQGNFNLNQGMLITHNIEMDGVLAKIKFNGQISLTDEENNLNMAVYPKVSTTLMTLVGMTAGPVGGAAAWFANKLVSPVVGQLMKMDYRVTGTWNHPVIKRING